MVGKITKARKLREAFSHFLCMFTLLMMTTEYNRGATDKKWLKLFRSFLPLETTIYENITRVQH